MINIQWLKLPMSRTNFHGPKDVRAIEVWLNFPGDMMKWNQKLLTWIRLTMICYIVPWWPSWLSDPIAFSNSESDVVWWVSRLPPWLPSWILELNDAAILNLHVTPMHPIKFRLNLTYCLGDVVWRISRWRPSRRLEQMDFSNSEFP